MAIAKPTKALSTVVTGACIKPPYMIRIKNPAFPASTFPSGFTEADYCLYVHGTKEKDYNPATESTASVIPLCGFVGKFPSKTGSTPTWSAFDFLFKVNQYYTGSGTYTATIASGLTLTQHTVEAHFSGCTVKISIDGKEYLDTDMFKPACPIYEVLAQGYAVNNSGSQVSLPSGWDAPWIVDVVQGADFGSLFNEVIPFIISFAAGMAVMALILKTLGKATAAMTARA